jgi:hypothetical protein
MQVLTFEQARQRVGRQPRHAVVKLNRHHLVSNAELLAYLADAIERGESELFGTSVAQGVRNLAEALARDAASGLEEKR